MKQGYRDTGNREKGTGRREQLSLISVLLAGVLTSCYLTITPVHPSAAAFHVAESPFFLNGQQRITGMASDGRNVVAVSHEGTIAFSQDHGVNWQVADPMLDAFADGIHFNALAWGEGYFLAGGDFGKAAWSKDGKVWHAGVIGPMNPKDILAISIGRLKNQSVFVAAGTDGRIAYALNSPEGPWFQIALSPFGDKEGEGESINALVYGRIKGTGIFIAAGDNGNIAVMNDFSGKFSGPSAAGTRQTFRGLAFGDERFIVVGDNAAMQISADPESYAWTNVRENFFALRPFHHIAYYPLLEFFVLIAEESVVGYSTNGESWSAASFVSHFANGISAIACTQKRIVLGGADGIIVYSN